MYQQRKNHKLSEWRYFCKWVEGLPLWWDIVNPDNHAIEEKNI